MGSHLPNIPIAITGMHRSGTSMITRALHDSGLHLIAAGAEGLIDAAEDNPEGFWENKAIVACNDELLEAAGGAWDNPPDLPPQAVDDPRLMHIADASTAALTALSEHDHWGFKDPRTCLTAAYWLDLQPDLRFIICVRHPIEVALSLKRRNQNSYSLGLALWERYYATVVELVPKDRRIVTHYDTFFLDPEGEIGRLCGFAGLTPVSPRVRSELRHHTTGVSLVDAGVSPSVRALYGELCREAGMPLPPEVPANEGRVRRLILDGAVAQRHADQRQDAIDRLHEREELFRAEHAASEAELRKRIRDLEAQLVSARDDAAARVDALHTETLQMLRTLSKAVARSPAGAGATSARFVQGPSRLRVALSRARRALMPAARSAAYRLPPPAQARLQRAQRLLRRGAAEPRPTAELVARRLAPKVRAVAVRVPMLPRRWMRGYDRMVAAVVPNGERWLAMMPGSPQRVRAARTPPAFPFPVHGDGRPSADDLAHIAQLEALRFDGYRHLVLPEGSRRWFRQRTELRDHLTRTARTVVDEPGAGAVFDLTERAVVGPRSLRGEVRRLAGALSDPPAVLDWTSLDLTRELPGVATFQPPAGDRLLYLDHSVDIVIVDTAHNLEDARRVASLAVITVATGASGVEVRDVELRSDVTERADLRVLVVSTAAAGDDNWRACLSARVAEAGADLRFATVGIAGLDALDDHDVVVVVERHVLPLPGAIETAARMASDDRSAAIAGKIVRADGRLEAAGGTVFFDRSVALIGESSADVRAPWHDYVRPVCWAPGLVAAASSLWATVPGPEARSGRPFVREWCAAVWADGGSVVYQPTVAAVRVAGDGGEAPTPLDESSWQRVLDLRPKRPRELSDDAWRHLLAHDDVDACRG